MALVKIKYDGDSGPVDRIHEIAQAYDPHYRLIGHERVRRMTLFVGDSIDLNGLEVDLLEARFAVQKRSC